MPDPKISIEELHLNGAELVEKVKSLVHQGNIRRISVRNAEGTTLIELPLVLGVAGVVLLPVWAALGALAALLARCTLVIERLEESPPEQETPSP